ncbi:hypothetical protein ACJX0J_021987 [Zea mays]
MGRDRDSERNEDWDRGRSSGIRGSIFVPLHLHSFSFNVMFLYKFVGLTLDTFGWLVVIFATKNVFMFTSFKQDGQTVSDLLGKQNWKEKSSFFTQDTRIWSGVDFANLNVWLGPVELTDAVALSHVLMAAALIHVTLKNSVHIRVYRRRQAMVNERYDTICIAQHLLTYL